MKKLILLVLILFSVSSYAVAYEYLKDYFIMSRTFFPTDEGDQNEKKLIEYITQHCIEKGVRYSLTKIDNDEVSTNSYNLELFLAGKKPDKGNIVLVVPLDSMIIRQEYKDVSVSHIVALELLNYFIEHKLDKNLLIVFSGANNRENDSPWGLTQYLQNRTGHLDQAVVTIMELIDSNNPIDVSGSAKRKAVPLEILKIINKLSEQHTNFRFQLKEIDKARFGLFNANKRLGVFLENGVTALRFSNYDEKAKFVPSYYSEELQTSSVSFFTEWIKQLDKLDPNFEKDYNYQAIRIHNFYLYMSEFAQILLYLIIIFLAIFSRRLIFYFRSKVRNLTLKTMPYFIFLFLSFYLLSFIPHFVGKMYMLFTGGALDYTGVSFFYFVVSFIVPFFLISGFLDLFHKFPFPRHNIVYMNGAVFFSYLNILIVTVIDISLVYIFLITVVALILSHVTGRNFLIKYIFYAISFIPFGFLLYNVSHGNPDLIKDSFDSPYFQHLVLCVLSYPFFLLLLRVSIINKMRFRIFSSKTAAVITASVVMAVFIAFYSVVLYSVLNKEKEGRVNVVNDYIKGNSYIELFCDSKIGALSVFDNGKKNSLQAGTYAKLPIAQESGKYAVKVNERGDGASLVITSEDRIEKIEAFLYCPKGITFFNTNFRYNLESYSENSEMDVYRILVPRNPGHSILFDFDLIPGYEYKLTLDIYYNEISGNIDVYSDMDVIFETTLDKDQVFLKPGE